MKKKNFRSFQLFVDKAVKDFKNNIYLINDQKISKSIKFKDIDIFLKNLGNFLKNKKISEQKKILICSNNDNFAGLLLIGLIYFNRIVIPVNPAFKKRGYKIYRKKF